MSLLADPYSSRSRPVLTGIAGAVSAAHPLAVAAGQEMLTAGGSAADATIAAQAVLCVVCPDACGLGGDMFGLVHRPGEMPVAVNAAGAAPMAQREFSISGPNSITTPGVVDGWGALSARWGRLALSQTLAPALRLAQGGFPAPARLVATARMQHDRLARGGASGWALMTLAPGDMLVQPALAALLRAIADQGPRAFYEGRWAAAIADAVRSLGGSLSADDLAGHHTSVRPPIMTPWRGQTLATQPPMAQGILLNMVLEGLERLGTPTAVQNEHALIELTEAAFAYRDRIAEGEALLREPLAIDPRRAGRRGGPRAYLHTAGVAVSDAEGLTISSLVSVFDDFGSCVFVPACGMVLNNRAGGFTQDANRAEPGKRPVHTLAPALVISSNRSLALATPGADGQIQTLAQVLSAIEHQGLDLATAVAKPRWRSEGGALLIEPSHTCADQLGALGHHITPTPDGDTRFGAMVCAGFCERSPFAVSDWRRETWSGVA